MAFDDIIGQEKWTKFILDAWKKDRLAHAILISGPSGCGKEFFALEIAKLLNCPEEGQYACGSCSSCRRISSLEHPNLQFVYPLPGGKSKSGSKNKSTDPLYGLGEDVLELIQLEISKKAKNPYYRIEIPRAKFIRIDSIRQLRENSYLKSAEPGKKVIILSRAEMMNDEAANSFLKLLEEPPPDTFLFLTTSKPNSLIPTIRSRCQEIKLKGLTDAQVTEKLVSFGNPVEEVRSIVKIVEGDISKALKLMEEGEIEERSAVADELVATIRSGLASDIVSMNRKLTAISSEGKEKLADIFLIALRLILKGGINDISRITGSKIGEQFDKAIDLVGRNIYIPMIFSALVFESRMLLKLNGNKGEIR